MASFDTVVQNGAVITPTGPVKVDIGIKDGQISELGSDLGTADEVIDAAERIVVPGGIDSHCHIEQETSTGLVPSDDFFTATAAAACGGTTTIIPFACQHRGQSLPDVVTAYHRAARKSAIDYAFHMIVSDPNQTTLKRDLPELAGKGYTSIKIYMTYDRLKLDDYQTLEILQTARDCGMIVMVHAESHDIIRWLTDRLTAEGKAAPSDHAEARHELAEREAAHRAITFSDLVGTPVLIAHVSGAMTIDQLRAARSAGVSIAAETCPQYLVLTANELGQPDFEGAKYLCCPPLRAKTDNVELWRGLREGALDVVSSDHSAYNFAGSSGKMMHGKDAPFQKVPMGLPGLEARLPILFSEGVSKGRIDIERFVELSSTNHAKLYGLYPRKGAIVIGADADLVLWNPTREWVLSTASLHDGVDYTPYEGLALKGAPDITLSRGEIVYDGSERMAKPGRGQFLSSRRIDAAAIEGLWQTHTRKSGRSASRLRKPV